MEISNLSKWDKRFILRALDVSQWSKDPKHKVGAIITDKYNRQICEGYNGPPRGVKDSNLSRDVLRYRSLHAEANAILFARQPLIDCTMYVMPYPPCAQCAAMIIQTGISRVIMLEMEENLHSWTESIVEARTMFSEVGVKTDVVPRKVYHEKIVKLNINKRVHESPGIKKEN